MFYWFGSMVVLTVLGLWANQRMNWRKKGTGERLTFRLPPEIRLFLAGFGLWFASAPPWLIVRNIRDATGWFLFVLIELMFCGAAALLLWGAGQRCELEMNTERRTYRFTSGWGLWPRVRSGRWDDFAGVFVRCVPVQNGEQCTVGLAWKGGGRITPILGRYETRQKADALAAEIAGILGLSRVAAPPTGTVRDILLRNHAS